MIEPKDASTCDERRVKNKLNPLTHKKKGETRIMSIQGTKHWQLGMFFVVSLMLMVGLFANSVLAHTDIDNDGEDEDSESATDAIGEVTISPDAVTAGSVVDLTITYKATRNLADPTFDTDEDGEEGIQQSYGRIRVTLPTGWGAADASGINPTRPSGNRDATYLVLTKSGSLAYAAIPLAVDGQIIDINVDKLLKGQRVILTIRNLMIAPLGTRRGGRFTDDASGIMDLPQIEVLSDRYNATEAPLDAGNVPAHPPDDFAPKVTLDTTVTPNVGSEIQPTMTVNRKTLGELTVSPAEVTAGSKKDFKFTYTASEALEPDVNNVIEIRLPAWDADPETVDFDPPSVYQHTDEAIPAEGDMGPYVYLSGSRSRLADTEISVINGAGGNAFDGTTRERDTSVTVNPDAEIAESWIVRIEVGDRGVSRSGTIVLNYKNAIVQRAMATDADDTQAPLMIQAFSGVSVLSADEPQFPVKELVKDIITVKRAADGSGTVEFELDDGRVVTGSSGNSDLSIPAGLIKDDVRSLIIRYTPEGDMGEGEFEIRLPSDWKADDILTDGDDETTKTGDPVHTVNVTFLEHFGEDVEEVEITLVDVTVPNNHGNHGFLSKSASEGGSLKQLSPRPTAFVGNTMADNDTVKVEIDPAAAYQNQDNVDFEITITANGPMHDSEIQITVPDGLSDLQDGDAAKANYVRKASASVSGVEVSVDNEIILIKTGKLNTDGRIKVRLDNVDLDGVSEIPQDGFRVETRTRTDVEPVEDDPTGNLSGEGFVNIEDDGDRSIVGGLIRTIAGSGTMAVEPATMEQGSRNSEH